MTKPLNVVSKFKDLFLPYSYLSLANNIILKYYGRLRVIFMDVNTSVSKQEVGQPRAVRCVKIGICSPAYQNFKMVV